MIVARNRAELRTELCRWLRTKCPEGRIISSISKAYEELTNLKQETLKADWARGGQMTGCNVFAQKVAYELGVPAGKKLTSGHLDLSDVDIDVPGSWVWANTGEAIDAKLHPLPGDIFCCTNRGKPFGHVGIVMEIDEVTQAWKWIAAGQGGPPVQDFIRWGPWEAGSARTFVQARPKVQGWVDIGWYMFPNERAPAPTPAMAIAR